MSLREVVTQLEKQLEKADFDFAAPDAFLAWQVFKDFAALPVNSAQLKASSIGVSLSHFADRDDELWLRFSRTIHLVEDGETAFTTAVSCDLSHSVPVELVAINWQISSSDFENLQQFFAAVESWTAFQRCMKLQKWQWEETRWNWESAEENEP